MWISAKKASEAIKQMEETAIESVEYIKESLIEVSICIDNMASYKPEIESTNPNLLNEISNIIKYGK